MVRTIKAFVFANIKYNLPTAHPNTASVDDERTDYDTMVTWLINECPVRATSAEFTHEVGPAIHYA